MDGWIGLNTQLFLGFENKEKLFLCCKQFGFFVGEQIKESVITHLICVLAVQLPQCFGCAVGMARNFGLSGEVHGQNLHLVKILVAAQTQKVRFKIEITSVHCDLMKNISITCSTS